MGGAGPYVTFDCSTANYLRWQRRSRLLRRREDLMRYWNIARGWLVGEHGLIAELLQDYEWEDEDWSVGSPEVS